MGNTVVSPANAAVPRSRRRGTLTDWTKRRESRWVLVALLTLAPLVICAVAVATRPWVPVLDLAMTELRVRDVGGRHTPLIGLPGRIGTFPDQGSHAGPWYFYLIAVVYRLTGSNSSGMEFATLIVNGAAIGGFLVAMFRRFGSSGLASATAVVVVLVRGYSMIVLAQPWNPYFPVLVWGGGVAATIAVFSGSVRLIPLVVATTSLAAQTHVPYLVPAIAINGAVLVWLGWRRRRSDLAPTLQGVLTATVMWLPPVVDQIVHRPGNLAMMFDHFTGEHAEPPIGLAGALRVITQHLDVLAAGVSLFSSSTPFIDRASDVTSVSIVGLAILVAWSAAAGWVVTTRARRWYPLFVVSALLLAVNTIALSQIFGRVWFYLTLWMPVTAILVWIGIAAVAWTGLRNSTPASSGPDGRRARVLVAVGGVLVAALVVRSVVDAVGYTVPERSQGEPVHHLMPSVVDGLDQDLASRGGQQGTYLVLWQEAVFSGSQGLALLNELDRRGFRVGVTETWRVPGTTHRVLGASEPTARLHLVSGPWIADWSARADATLLGEVDTRTPAQRARFAELQTRVIERLTAIGRDDLISDARRSIFSLSLRTDIPSEITDQADELAEIGVPVAVFLEPARNAP